MIIYLSQTSESEDDIDYELRWTRSGPQGANNVNIFTFNANVFTSTVNPESFNICNIIRKSLNCTSIKNVLILR